MVENLVILFFFHDKWPGLIPRFKVKVVFWFCRCNWDHEGYLAQNITTFFNEVYDYITKSLNSCLSSLTTKSTFVQHLKKSSVHFSKINWKHYTILTIRLNVIKTPSVWLLSLFTYVIIVPFLMIQMNSDQLWPLKKR